MYQLKFKKGVMPMILCFLVIFERRKSLSVADAIGLMFLFGMFIFAMLTYIERKK